MGDLASTKLTSLTLFCSKLNIEIQFNLECGSFARIGSGDDMEVTLPIAGVNDFELRLDRDHSGNLIASTEGRTYVVTEETGLTIGHHYFALRPELKPTPSQQVTTTLPPTNYQSHPLPPERKPHSAWHGLGTKARLISISFIACLAIMGLILAFKNGSGSKTQPTVVSRESAEGTGVPTEVVAKDSSALDIAPAKPIDQLDWNQIAEDAKKSVFQLNVLNEHGQPYALGTAFCIAPEGYLITNAHVIKGSENFEAVTAQGAAFKVKNVRHFDETHDLAVLEIDAREWTGLKLADVEKPRVGEPVAVYGSPKGMQGSFSEGVVSALRPGSDLGKTAIGNLIQISAPISEGSSGSPVMNTKGEVIGVATMVMKSSQNLNFAVPVIALKNLLKTRPMIEGEFESINAVANQEFSSEKKEDSPLPVTPSPDRLWSSDPEAKALEQASKSSNWFEMFRIAKSLVSKYPESAAAHFQMGYAASELSLHEAAIRSYKEALAKYPESAAAWNNLGCAYGKVRRPLDAELAFNQAVEVDPSNSLAWNNLARFRAINEKWDDAVHALIALAQLDKPSAERVLSDLQNAFGRSAPQDIKRITAAYRARNPLPTSDPTALGKKLAARFLAFGAGDNIDAELRSYADIVEPYFGESRKAASDILKDLIDYRSKWPARSYDLNSFESAKLNSSKNVLVVKYSFQFQVAGNGRERKGVIRHETTFSRVSDDLWIVKGVRTLSSREE